jgi:hypothetical protein
MIKYPRTYHLPFSPGATSDDKSWSDCSGLKDKRVVVLEKMDGENTTLTRSSLYSRSPTAISHESQSWVRNLHATVLWNIPEDIRIVGENLYAHHSIFYENLESYFQVFSVWSNSNNNRYLSFEETLEWCDILELVHVPVLIEPHIFDEKLLLELATTINTETTEGFVVRNADSFHHREFSSNVAKWVRPNHVTTDGNWKTNWQRNGELRK